MHKLEKVLVSLITLAAVIAGALLGAMTVKPQIHTIPVEKPVIVTKEVVKPVYVNNTIPVEKLVYVNRTIEVPVVKEKIVSPAIDFKDSIVEYLSEKFDDCQGFNMSGYAKEEIKLYDLDNIEFMVEFDDENSNEIDFSNITVQAYYKYKAEDLPREYHGFNVSLNYDNEEKEIKNCTMVQIE